MANLLDQHSVFDFPLSGSQLIEASAGTGKTYTIANLYLRHILAGRRVGEVLVVTFTDPATEELRGRIRARLQQAMRLLQRHGGDHPRAKSDPFLNALPRHLADKEQAIAQLQLAVHSMDEAAIHTIHGFCQRMLTEFAFNSGQGFRLEVIGDDSDLRRQLVRDWWRMRFYRDTDPGLVSAILTQIGDPDQFLQRLTPLLDLDPPTLLPDPVDWQTLTDAWHEITILTTRLIADWHTHGDELKAQLLGGSAYKKGCLYRKKLEARLTLIDHYLLDLGQLPPGDALEALQQTLIHKAQLKKRDPKLDHPLFEAADQISEQLQDLQHRILPWALADAATEIRKGLYKLKQNHQQLSYNDLIGHLRDALQGERGAALATAIRERYPVAMIDEFQDTDPTQYSIFHTVYHGYHDGAWTMIGDPKQAIYSFRGGDIFTYARAKTDIGTTGLYTLDTNWRSVPAVVEGCNRLFGVRDDAFIYSDAIPFDPIKPADKRHEPLIDTGLDTGLDTGPDRRQTGPGLIVWRMISDDGGGKPISAEAANPGINRAVCAEIARLIESGRNGQATLGTRALRPGDIAVLVRTHHQAGELRDQLRRWGIDAVTVGDQSVFSGDEAGSLLGLLLAIAAPGDRRAAANALGSPLLGLDYPAIYQRSNDDDAWGQWRADLADLHDRWLRQGFMAMFQDMLQTLEIPAAIAAGANAERRITNLLHLGELCQQAAKAHPGMDALLHWMAEQIQQPNGEQQELRLESDDELVQLVTIHKSKGLEYPVVFVPYLWSCRPRNSQQGVRFHQDEQPALDLGSPLQDPHLRLAEKERLAEDLRLLYVAVTRARVRSYLVWGTLGGGSSNYRRTALGYLLLNAQSPDDLDHDLPDAAPKGTAADTVAQAIDALAEDPAVTVLDLPEVDESDIRAQAGEQQQRRFAQRPPSRRIATDWRVESFSALARDIPGHRITPTKRDDAADSDPALHFPRGSHAGSFLHALLERLDFQADLPPQISALAPQLGPRYGFTPDPLMQQDLRHWLGQVLATAVDGQHLRLDALSNAQRLNELEFDFSTGPVDIAALDKLLSHIAGKTLPGIGADTFQGMVNGIIDLVFEYQGRYYLADYKSNYLGPQFSDYAAEQLHGAILNHRYDLQYMLYSLALHRYLGKRIVAYDYEQHFGGAYYLFLRGMRPQTGAMQGVYFCKPDYKIIDRLDRQVFHQ